MQKPIAAAAVALAVTSFVPPAFAQATARLGKKTADPAATRASTAQVPADGAPAAMPRAINAKPLQDNSEVPGPTMPTADEDSNKGDSGPVVPLPTGSLEPYMLTKENGPFMVLAYTFRGPQAPRQALALTLELRNKFRLPAYILLPKKFPSKSNIRGVPPQANQFATRDDVGVPEIYRTLDEAAVLIGDEKTIKDSNVLMHKVKKLHPDCIDGVQEMWKWRTGKGLTRAIMTTNPFVPAEALFPAQQDVMITQINQGPHSIKNCPGRYSLEIANFAGRKTLDMNDRRFAGDRALKMSPLMTASDDAERLADALSRDKEIQKTGFQPYVYHDRFSSRVMIGSFDSPSAREAQLLHDKMIQMTVELNQRKVTNNAVIVPAPNLTDLSKIKAQLQPAPLQVRAN